MKFAGKLKNVVNMYIDVTIEEVQYIHYGIRMASECGPRCGGQPSQQPAASSRTWQCITINLVRASSGRMFILIVSLLIQASITHTG